MQECERLYYSIYDMREPLEKSTFRLCQISIFQVVRV